MESTGRTETEVFASYASHLNICTVPNISVLQGLYGDFQVTLDFTEE